jgi:hypothetical protein
MTITQYKIKEVHFGNEVIYNVERKLPPQRIFRPMFGGWHTAIQAVGSIHKYHATGPAAGSGFSICHEAVVIY